MATKARGSRRIVKFRGATITERQKEILELWEKFEAQDGVSNIASAVADELDITPNAVYIARKRINEALNKAANEGENGQPFNDKRARRTVSLDDYKREQRHVEVSEELADVASITQQKLINLSEVENELEEKLDEVKRAKAGLSRVLDNITVTDPAAA